MLAKGARVPRSGWLKWLKAKMQDLNEDTEWNDMLGKKGILHSKPERTGKGGRRGGAENPAAHY